MQQVPVRRMRAAKQNGPSGPFAYRLAEWTGLEPATPGVTGRYSNQLNYHSSNPGAGRQVPRGANMVASPRGFEPL